MKFVVFGTGKYYLNRKEQLFGLCDDAEIVCFFDNNIDERMEFEGKKIWKPQQLEETVFDKILLMSRSYLDTKKQLIDLGYDSASIWTWEQFVCEMNHGKYEFFCGETCYNTNNKKILIISTYLGYNGGSIAAVYAAKALSDRYEVILAAPGGDREFVKEMAADGVSILLSPAIPYWGKEELYLIQKFDYILVNVFQMLPVVCQVSSMKPTIWWIHEPSNMYKDILDQYSDFLNLNIFDTINIKAVSNVPKMNFNSYFPNIIHGTMAYGIPDKFKRDTLKNECKGLVFAVVGGIVPRKAQDIFLEAIMSLRNKHNSKNIEYWLIGGIGEDEYCNMIRKIAKESDQVKIKGKLTREEIDRAYQQIDVVVCPSREDPLPIVMTEGMMYGKVCIASDATGTADFIEDGVNGLLCKAGDVESLASKMQWVIDHPERLVDMRKNARKTYEKYFTMEKFAQRLDTVITETIEAYEE